MVDNSLDALMEPLCKFKPATGVKIWRLRVHDIDYTEYHQTHTNVSLVFEFNFYNMYSFALFFLFSVNCVFLVL